MVLSDVQFANAVGERVELSIRGLDVLKEKRLPGTVIRSSEDQGTYTVGCRMLEDNMEILQYVEERMKK